MSGVRPLSGEQYEIAFDDQRATVVEVGGGLRTYAAGGREVLDGYGLDEMCTGGSGQPLIPWPNRLAGGRYDFAGTALQLPLTEPAKNNAIHGLTRFANWSVAHHASDHVVMRHTLHPQPGYPFLLALEITYALDAQGLRVTTIATNIGPTACPFGVGFHPYVRIGDGMIDDLELQHPAATWMPTDDHAIPIGRDAVAGSQYDFTTLRPIGATVIDTAFTDLARDERGIATVTLRDPSSGAGVELWCDDAYEHLMLFTGDTLDDPAQRRRALGVEPMTCAPNAFRTGDGLLVLEPEASTIAVWGLRATSA